MLRGRNWLKTGIVGFLISLLLSFVAFSTTASGQAGVVYQSGQTAFGPITGGGNCSSSLANETPPRTLADTLDDAWFAAGGKDMVDVGLFPNADIGPISNSYSLAFPNLPITVEIGKYDISPADAVSNATASFGTIDDAGGTDPSLLTGGSEQMQDCSPKPLSLVSAAEGGPLAQPTPYWNAVGFAADQTSLDSVLFSFSAPVDNFGAWFGDLETRVEDATTGPDDGGALAYVKLYAADGSVLAVQPVLPNNQRPVSNDTNPPGSAGFDDDGFGCGDQDQDEDFSSCGNHGTRFLGFNWPTNDVAHMQVIVGDDDHCNEVGSCAGLTEHLSFIGPQMAYDNPEVSFVKTVVNNDLGTLTASDFPLTLTADPAVGAVRSEHRSGDVVELTTGVAYQVSEDPVTGYDLVSIECVDGSGLALPVAFTPTLDQKISCTVVNDDIPAPTTTAPPTTAPPTTAPATTAPATTAQATTAPPTTPAPTISEPAATSTTVVVDALPVTGSSTNHLLGLGWLLLAAGASLWAFSLRRQPLR